MSLSRCSKLLCHQVSLTIDSILQSGPTQAIADNAYLCTHGGNVLIRGVSESRGLECLQPPGIAKNRINTKALSYIEGPWAILGQRGDCLTAERCAMKSL